MENICYSGGCAGADELFGNCAKEVGHETIHYMFKGAKTNCKEGCFYLNDLQLLQADKYLVEANKYLKRTFPCNSVYVNNLLRRNYYQIEKTNRIYAVSNFSYGFLYNGIPGLVEGGTGWAVIMGMLKKIPEIYVFYLKNDCWYKFIAFDGDIAQWKRGVEVPFPSGKYTGIGKHDLPENGANAIKRLFNL